MQTTSKLLVSLLLCLILCSVSGCGGSPELSVSEQLEIASELDSTFMDAMKSNDVSKMRDAHMFFRSKKEKFSGCSPEFQAAHEKHSEAMVDYAVAKAQSTDPSVIKEFGREVIQISLERDRQKYVDSSSDYTKALEKERTRLKSGGK